MEVVTDIEGVFRAEFPRLVRALAVTYDNETAVDAVQDAFIEADRRWSRVSKYADPAGWVRRVAINKASNSRRNTRRRREILESIRPVEREQLTDALLDLRAAVAQLPDQMRLTVCLHYLADLGVSEIASTLDVSPGTVKSNLHDARNRLRTLLEEEPHG